jgi:acetoacetyl-CoA synthetase
MINPISGGTDLLGIFVGGDPTKPFFAGEMTGPALGVAVEVYTDSGSRAIDDEPGELVCLAPFPTVPLGLWGDPDGSQLRNTYFDIWPGVWVHGDRAVRSSRGGIAILGRSDATLNVGGVRIGTSEIYSALSDHENIRECLAFGQEFNDDTRIVLLVVASSAGSLDENAKSDIRAAIRSTCSPRHVPSLILEVPDLPKTQTGKISEIAVRESVHGREVKGLTALANPQSLQRIAEILKGTE